MTVAIDIRAQASIPRSRRDNRQAILVAGCALFARHGLAGVTFDDVARETGLTRRTIYNHFANVDDLFLASTQGMLQQLKARLPATPAVEQPLGIAIDRFVRELLGLFTHPRFADVHLVLVRHGTDHPVLRRAFEQQVLAPLYAMFSAYLRARSAHTRVDESCRMAQEVVTAVLGLAETARLLGRSGEEAARHVLPLAGTIARTLVQGERERLAA